MFGNVPQMFRAAAIALTSTQIKREDTVRVFVPSLHRRLVAYFFGNLTELVCWTVVLFIGQYFIMTAPDVVSIVRSTVSVAFVVNTDELIYQACCSPHIKLEVNDVRCAPRPQKSPTPPKESPISRKKRPDDVGHGSYEMRHVLSLLGGEERTGRMRLFHAIYKYFHYWHLFLIFACMASLVMGLRVTYIQGCSPESFMFLTNWFHDH
jgi:hypothetical protein